MNIAEAIRIALRSLWANKLRSVLTLLGVVIGIAAVIAVVTFVSGIQDYVATKIFNLGADVFIIAKMSPVETNVEHFLVAEKRKNLKLEDYQAVLEACSHCQYVGAMARGSGKVKHNEQSISDTTIQGITPSVASILDTDLTYGRMLNDTDLKWPVIKDDASLSKNTTPSATSRGSACRAESSATISRTCRRSSGDNAIVP